MTLWGRRAKVQVGALLVENLDVRFQVQLDDSNIGKAEIAIFNLNEVHRKRIEQEANAPGAGVEVTLSAGYQDQPLAQLFKGDVREAASMRDPPDWVTALRTGDGDGVAQARVNKAYGKGAPLSVMWKDAVTALQAQAGIGVGNAIAAFQRGQFADGVNALLSGGALQGSVIKEIQRLAKAAHLDVSVQDKELVVTPTGTPLEATAVLLSPQTGLIGSPERARTKGAQVLKVKALLIPGLRPKRTVQVQSSLVSGLYVIRKATYKGDTAGQDWYVDMECVEQ